MIHNILLHLPPEQAHSLALKGLQLAYRLGLTRLLLKKIPSTPRHVMGLKFPNHIGLAAGFDKNGDYIDALATLGFGFIEIGTITPKPQLGNPRPRLFRLSNHKAIINRMGFNNKGMHYVANRLKQTRYRGILGINIGKNKDTPIEHATDDYRAAFHCLYEFASYITINISSPNTPNLRDLQHKDLLQNLLFQLKQDQKTIFETKNKYIPLVVKISPDLTPIQLCELCESLNENKIDGVIATNTTVDRPYIANTLLASEIGGLSGRPLKERSTELIKQLRIHLNKNIPIIASGGIVDKAAATEKLTAGAELVQVYTGLIYSGASIISQLVQLS